MRRLEARPCFPSPPSHALTARPSTLQETPCVSYRRINLSQDRYSDLSGQHIACTSSSAGHAKFNLAMQGADEQLFGRIAGADSRCRSAEPRQDPRYPKNASSALRCILYRVSAGTLTCFLSCHAARQDLIASWAFVCVCVCGGGGGGGVAEGQTWPDYASWAYAKFKSLLHGGSNYSHVQRLISLLTPRRMTCKLFIFLGSAAISLTL